MKYKQKLYHNSPVTGETHVAHIKTYELMRKKAAIYRTCRKHINIVT